MTNKIFIVFATIVLILCLFGAAQKMDVVFAQAPEVVELDEDIQPRDLGVREPKILPGSLLYFLKSINRGIQSVFTFNSVAKAELRLKFANEKLIEAKKAAKTKPEVLTKALENYKIETDKLKAATDKIVGTTDNPKVDKFLDKFVDNTLKQQKLFGKLEKDLPAETHEIVEKTKDENMAKFSDISLKLTSPEILREKIVKTVEVQPGSDFKQFKNLEVLQQVAEKVPETAKPAIQQAIENSFNRLKEDLEALSPEDREKFKDYIENIGGNETRHLAIVDEFERAEMSQIVREEVEKAKQKILERIETRLKEYKEKQLEAAQKEYLSHLTKQGRIEDLRVVKEMENNLSPEVAVEVMDTKKEAAQKLAERIELAQTPEQQKEFFKNIENKYHDIQQLEVFKEIDELIPPEKKELYEKLKEKALSKMGEEVERAKKMGAEEKIVVIDKLAGDAPEHIKVLEDMVPEPARPEIARATVENIIKKAELVEDPAKVEITKQKMEEREIKKVAEPLKLGVVSRLEAKSEALMRAVDHDMAAKQIGVAKNTIETCGRALDSLKTEVRENVRSNPPYKTLMETAFKHLSSAEKALANQNFGEAFGQATAASQQASNACKSVVDVVTKKITDEDRFNKWKEFFRKLAEIAPETFPYGYDEKLVPGITILINCSLPDISGAKSCKDIDGKVLLRADPNQCPYFECSKKVAAEVREECAIGNIRYHQCANGEQVQWCACKDWKWSCIDSPEKICPTVEKKYYTCPDGTKVESGKCYVKDGVISACGILTRPEMKCPLQAPPVTPLAECATVREIKYYQCSDGSQIPWCACGPEGSFAGAKNKWQCQYYPIGFTCPKSTATPAPTPNQPFACYIKEACITMYNKEECLGKGGKPTSNSSCPIATPTQNKATDYIYGDCAKEGMSKYRCPNGNAIDWKCSCLVSVPEPQYRSGGYTTWSCSVEPGKSCSIFDAASLAIVSIQVRYYAGSLAQIFWTTNAPTDSYLEYGSTTSYETRASGNTIENPGGTQKVVQDLSVGFASDKKLRPGKTYHFRITATDTKGNKLVSNDYSFNTIPECIADTAKSQVPTEYYFCPNGTSVPWCKCTSEQKWSCVSPPESACPVVREQPAVQQPTVAECKFGEIKQYKCSDGTLLDYCKCTLAGKWDCIASPEKSCPLSTPVVTPSAATEKALAVISPNGGETWYMGKTYDILWKSSGIDKVNIEVHVFKDGASVGNLSIAGSDLITLASVGKYSWTPNSQHLREGNQFKIVIRNAETPYTPEDESDAYFKIVDVAAPTGFKLIENRLASLFGQIID